MPSSLVTTIRRRRAAAGWTQAELARRVGVSRQALSAVEAGRQVPSTVLALQLGKVLRCAVEDLFRLPGGALREAVLAPGRTSPRVLLGRVDGRLVAHFLHDPRRAADGLVHGSGGEGRGSVELLSDEARVRGTVLVAGCAPLLGALAERASAAGRDRVVWVPADSGQALALLEQRLVHVAGVHLAAADAPDVHVALARGRAPHGRALLVHLARWRQGLVLAAGNPLGVTEVADLGRPELRLAWRRPGAGAHRVLAAMLEEAGREVPAVSSEPVADDHDEVAWLVRRGLADVGVAIEASAVPQGLAFVPVAEERFDLIVPAAYLDRPPVARFLDRIDPTALSGEAAGAPGYDVSAAGSTIPVGAP